MFEALSLLFADEPMRPMMPAVPNFPTAAISSVSASCRLPGANDPDELWQLVSEERDCHQGYPTSRFDTDQSFRVTQSGNLSWLKSLEWQLHRHFVF
jgi:hypothetical protein